MDLQNFYVAVGVILPILDRKLSANMNIHPASGVVRLGVIGMVARLITNGDQPVPDQHPCSTRQGFKKLNDLKVDQQTIIHDLPPGAVLNRLSNSSKVAKSSARLSIFRVNLVRCAASIESSRATRNACTCLRSCGSNAVSSFLIASILIQFDFSNFRTIYERAF